MLDKLRAVLTDWLSMTDKELETEYRLRNDKVKLAVVTFMADSFRPQATATDAEVAAYFDAHQADFTIPEKRKVRYLLVDVDAIRAKTTVPDANIERAYNESIEQYSTPEQVRASHILLRTEGKDDAVGEGEGRGPPQAGQERRGLRRSWRRRIRKTKAAPRTAATSTTSAGARWCRSSIRSSSRWSPGRSSDLVKTQFGYHIIKLVDKKPATMRTLAEVRQQIVDQLAFETARAQAADLAQTIAAEVSTAGRPGHGRQGARPDRAGIRILRARTSRLPASAPRRKPCRARLRD